LERFPSDDTIRNFFLRLIKCPSGGFALDLDSTVFCREGKQERHRRLPARRHFEKTSASGFQPLHNSTDFEPRAVRENAHSTSAFSTPASIRVAHHTKSSMFTGFLNRTVVKNVLCADYRKKCDKIWLVIIMDRFKASSFSSIPDTTLEHSYTHNFDSAFLFFLRLHAFAEAAFSFAKFVVLF